MTVGPEAVAAITPKLVSRGMAAPASICTAVAVAVAAGLTVERRMVAPMAFSLRSSGTTAPAPRCRPVAAAS